MENIKKENIEPADGNMVVAKSEAGKVLKEHGYKVANSDIDSFVSLKDINKIYPNGVQAVYDFNIDIKEKDFIVLVGPSGCGKSTTLRMIAGLEDITSGYLYIDKVLSNYLASKDRDISMVFQAYALYPQMTVFDNMAFPLKVRKHNRPVVAEKTFAWNEVLKHIDDPREFVLSLREANDKSLNFGTVVEYVATKLEICDLASKILCSFKATSVEDFEKKDNNGVTLKEKIKNQAEKEIWLEKEKLNAKGFEINEQCQIVKDGIVQYKEVKMSKEEIRKKVFDAAKILDLGPYLDRRPKELSGGQMQRVALGRAIVRNAKLFLMDEPLSNLDAKLRVQMRSEIVRIHEQIGATTIYVTHDQTEAMTMATKIAVMSKGWVQQIGTPTEIYYNPKNIFVATFIGSPAMNIFEGVYEKGAITFKDGFSVKLPKEFSQRHDKFYEDKIADLERMLKTDDFKKMHALRVIDKVLFEKQEPIENSHIEKALQSVLASAIHLGQECVDKISSLLNEYLGEKLIALQEQYNAAKQINAKLKLEEISDIVNTISSNDIYGKEAIAIIATELEKLSLVDYANTDLSVYLAFNKAIKDAIDYVESLDDDNKLLLSQLKKLVITDKLPNGAHLWLKSIRKPLLTFDKIPSSDIGKLHNAHIFNKNEISDSQTMYYQKPKKSSKHKQQLKINLNSVDVEFVNNLYEIAINQLEEAKKALAGKHGVRIGVRPEDIHLANEYFDENKTATFTVKTGIVELLGSELLIHSEWSGANLIAKISTGTLVKPHTDVELVLNKDKIYVFDETCGDTI